MGTTITYLPVRLDGRNPIIRGQQFISSAIDSNEEVKVHLWAIMPSVTFIIRLFFQLLLFSQNARKYPVSVETVVFVLLNKL